MDDDGDDDDGFGGASVEEGGGLGEDTGNVGLFAHNRRTGEEDGEAAGAGAPTGARPGVAAVTVPQHAVVRSFRSAAAAAGAEPAPAAARPRWRRCSPTRPSRTS